MVTKLQIYESIFGALFTIIAQFIKHYAQGKKVWTTKHIMVSCISGIIWIFHFLVRKELVYCAKQTLRKREKEKKLKKLKKLKK
jgi:amino acid permease